MIPSVIYLRKQSVLPDGLTLRQESLNKEWNLVMDTSRLEMIQLLRESRWLYVCMQRPQSCIGMASTIERARLKAIRSGLGSVHPVFNAAEIETVTVLRYGMIYFVKITLYSRQIQPGFFSSPRRPA